MWNQVWKIMKGMELRSVVVDLEACLEGGRVERNVEREILGPLGAVSVRGGKEGAFVVRVTWEGDSEEEVEEVLGTRTFRLLRVRRGRREVGGGRSNSLESAADGALQGCRRADAAER